MLAAYSVFFSRNCSAVSLMGNPSPSVSSQWPPPPPPPPPPLPDTSPWPPPAPAPPPANRRDRIGRGSRYKNAKGIGKPSPLLVVFLAPTPAAMLAFTLRVFGLTAGGRLTISGFFFFTIFVCVVACVVVCVVVCVVFGDDGAGGLSARRTEDATVLDDAAMSMRHLKKRAKTKEDE
ncbi:Uncharacterized protein APZ42_030500 [Daphnia magna]|uniref:Uncharacterized protein n=1 Tax=Daphnia magna TaxID=35525 RepID=A0A164NJ95_9CRUS|nr:Uncharacterized protein APZ42_030500 [Daphnia magna]